MADCKIQSYNAIRAQIFGKKLTMTQRIILMRCGWFTHNEFQYSGRYNQISHSATLMEGSRGSRFKLIRYTHPERWDTVIVPLTDEQEDRAYERAKELNGTPYDTIGQLSHITGFKIWKPSKKKIWCTKDVAEQVYIARPEFYFWISKLLDTTELRPDQMDMMARYYFERCLAEGLKLGKEIRIK